MTSVHICLEPYLENKKGENNFGYTNVRQIGYFSFLIHHKKNEGLMKGERNSKTGFLPVFLYPKNYSTKMLKDKTFQENKSC